MIPYQTKVSKLSGSNYKEVMKGARLIFHDLERQTKRRTHIRSAYFSKEKIFLDYFWPHLNEKSFPDRKRRLQYFPCAIDLLKNSKLGPTSKSSPHRSDEILHRFTGQTPEGEVFFVQVKENYKTKKKYFLSVFPLE
jgi:hypothetical protein